MKEYLLIFLKSIISYIVLLILTRIMGKKQLSQMTSFDYIVSITIGSITAAISVDRRINDIDGLIAVLSWAVLPIITGYIGLKNSRFRRLTDGESSILIDKGQVNDKNMRKARYNMKDLLMQLRQKDIFDIAEVDFALLEPNGQLSVLKKQELHNVTLKDLNIKTPYKGMVIDIIANGEIIYDHLSMIKKDERWLKDQLKNKQIKDIIYAGFTSENKLEFVLMNNLKGKQH